MVSNPLTHSDVSSLRSLFETRLVVCRWGNRVLTPDAHLAAEPAVNSAPRTATGALRYKILSIDIFATR